MTFKVNLLQHIPIHTHTVLKEYVQSIKFPWNSLKHLPWMHLHPLSGWKAESQARGASFHALLPLLVLQIQQTRIHWLWEAPHRGRLLITAHCSPGELRGPPSGTLYRVTREAGLGTSWPQSRSVTSFKISKAKMLFHWGCSSGRQNKFARLLVTKQELLRQHQFLGTVPDELQRSSAQVLLVKAEA